MATRVALPSIADPKSLAKVVENLRTKAIFADGNEGDSVEDDTVLATPVCEQYFLLGIAALESAERYFALAELARARGQ